MTISNQNKQEDIKREILLLTILNVCVIMVAYIQCKKERKGKYIPENVYNQMKEILIKDWKEKTLLGIYSGEYIPDLTNNDIYQRVK